MAVLLGCSTAGSAVNGYSSDSISGKKRKKSHLPCLPYFSYFNSGSEPCCNSFRIHGLPMLKTVLGSGRRLGLESHEIVGIDCEYWLRKKNNLVRFSSYGSGLVCEEEISVPTWIGEDQQTVESGEDEVTCQAVPTTREDITNDSPNLSIRLDGSRIKLHFLEERDEELLSNRILNLSRSNKVRSSLELYASMRALKLQPNPHACNSLLSCLLRHGLIDDALKVFETMRVRGIATGHTYSLILKAVASNRGCDSALEIFNGLETEETSVKNFDIIVYNTMIAACGKAKNWVETEKLWRRLKQNFLRGTRITYRLLVSTFVQCGQTELALDVYHEMIENGLEPDEDIMKAVVVSCSKEGNWTVALNVFQKMLDSGAKPNIVTYNAMINCLGKAGETDLAFRIYDLMKSSGHTPDAYTWSALLSALYRGQRYADTLSLFLSIKQEHSSLLNAHLYNTTLMACQKLGFWERSLQLLWQMETSDMLVLTESYNHVIRACEAARKPKVALQVYHRMIQQKCAPDTFTYLSLIRACVWGSLWTEIEEILESVTPNASLYNALIHGFCLRGKFTLAKKLYRQMCTTGLKADGRTRALMLQYLPNDRTKKS